MPTLKERFWAKVQLCQHGKTCTRCCWEWQGSTHQRGYGHPFNEDNTRIDPTTGGRRCRQCDRLRAYAYKKKKGLIHA
jgi:hypothetical protein